MFPAGEEMPMRYASYHRAFDPLVILGWLVLVAVPVAIVAVIALVT